MPELALLAATEADYASAARLAQHLGLPLLATGIEPAHCDAAAALLIVEDSVLRLQTTGRAAPGPVLVDFGSAGMRHRRNSGSRELLGRAVGHGKKPVLNVLDATAGLARDAFVLADLGCEVVLCERDPVIVELLRSGLLAAAGSDDPWLTAVVQRMHLSPGDARELVPAKMASVDVIYLDPMFPTRRKSAAVKKEMAVFQSLLERSTNPQDADDLLVWALRQNTPRVVVKRPAKAASLAGQKPSHRIVGKSVRYDVYVHRKLL
ncbi:Ribosomal RNA small subunit methyltransferase J [Halioglobus japonicus]|nr:Ribosomal RNA small subunit methyltransferase J [Halioglobus japonicus]